MSKALKNELFTKKISMFNQFLNNKGVPLFYHYNFKKSNMNKCIRTTQIFRKLVVSMPLNWLAFKSTKNAKLCLHGTSSLFSIQNSSITLYNQQIITDENNNKDSQNQKISRKVPEESVEAI